MSIVSDDAYLVPYAARLKARRERLESLERRLAGEAGRLADFAGGHEHFGLHRRDGEWIFREWAPNAEALFLIGEFSNWQPAEACRLTRCDHGQWELSLPDDALRHGDLYRLHVAWPGGAGDRIPAYARRVVQDHHTNIFNAQVWAPSKPYAWKYDPPDRPTFPLVYEAHVGMAQEKEGVGTYTEFRENILPRIRKAGYNTLQLMALMEHPYYGSFGYHVSSYFAASSRFGTPEELKALIDAAHAAGLFVTMDLVHSHAAKNEVEGLSRFDGSDYQYFHGGPRGQHPAWDSRCFDYGKPEVLHFLLSNCRFWLDEYRVDGFRFDGITSMLYIHHGLGPAFDHYDRYFDDSVDEEALAYLAAANRLIHDLRPDAITVAEDVSGMPGLAAPVERGGCGFDYRLAMGIPDHWFRLVNDVRDEDWHMGQLWHELSNRRPEERVISYVESHDQALVGGKSLIFEMIDADMYGFMRRGDQNLMVERGVALHKMARLATLATAGHGYLSFMGNEFGHPEWVDFPREGNGWSYKYARRQWSLRDNRDLKYGDLAAFDEAMLALFRPEMRTAVPRLVSVDEDARMLAIERGGCVLCFNFHADRSVTDYPVMVPPGRYRLVLDTDEQRFAGQGRLEPHQEYTGEPCREGGEIVHRVRIYLPCRVALVLGRH